MIRRNYLYFSIILVILQHSDALCAKNAGKTKVCLHFSEEKLLYLFYLTRVDSR